MTWQLVSDSLSAVWDIVDSCVTFIAGNPVMMVLFAGSLIPLGLRIFRKAKHTVVR